MTHNTLIHHLLHTANIYPQPVEAATIKLVETHISWVILTGKYAYKIKKPVNMGFLDFSTLDKRKFYCELELKYNQAIAKEIYCDILAVVAHKQQYQILSLPAAQAAVEHNKNAQIIEYMIQMREFQQNQLLSNIIHEHGIAPSIINEIATKLANFHLHADTVLPFPYLGSANAVHQPVMENFRQIADLIHNIAPDELAIIQQLKAWNIQFYQQNEAFLQQRQQDGYIRACHGDLHLGNIAITDNHPIIFDCIEFNQTLRWIDPIAEIAFMCMDLDYHNNSNLAFRFLNHYLEHTGDYAGLKILAYYLCYRACVRAKVKLLTAQQDLNSKDLYAAKHWQTFCKLINLALSYTEFPQNYTSVHQKPRVQQPVLILMHGYSGVGKTTISQSLIEELGCIRLRSDIERKRLAGIYPSLTATTPSISSQNLYSSASSTTTFNHLYNVSNNLLQNSYSTIVDATFLRHADRQKFVKLAIEQNAIPVILSLTADQETITERLQYRMLTSHDASDATPQVLAKQIDTVEPLSAPEKCYVIAHNTAIEDITTLLQKIHNYLREQQPTNQSKTSKILSAL